MLWSEAAEIGGGTRMNFGRMAILLLLTAAVAGCGSSQTITVTISPTSASVVRTGSQQFGASVAGISNTLVTWYVCNPSPQTIATGSSTAANIVLPTGCEEGGNQILGAVTQTGLYTAPTAVPPNSEVSVVAVSQGNTAYYAIVDVTIDSGVRVSLSPASATVGTLEQFQLQATVTGNSNTAVSWAVNGIANGQASTVGTIAATACTATMPVTPTSSYPVPAGTSYGCYTAPSTPQSSIVITATAAADTAEIATSNLVVTGATDPQFSTNIPLEPTFAVEGSAQQDVYLFGSNFFTTSQVVVNNAPVPTTFVNTATLRATIPSSFFSAPAPNGLAISIERQNGDIIQPPITLAVQPSRPAVSALNPLSFPTSTQSATLDLNGGYFSSSTQVSSEGLTLSSSLLSSRQVQVTLSGPNFSFSTPGLVPIVVKNTDVPSGAPFMSSVNVAITPSNIPTSANSPIGVGTQPVAVGIDSALGVAVVVDEGGGSGGAVSLLNLDTGAGPVTVPVGNAPTSVGVDDILHLAAVVNSADNTLSIVNLQTQTASTVALPANPTGISPAPSPYAVGVNPLTHRALIAYSSTNIATVFDLSTSPPSLVCTMGGSDPTMPNNCAANSQSNTRPVSTGPTPTIAVEPRLNWAIVTPGGSGTVTVIDMGMDATANQAARAPNPIASFSGVPTGTEGVAINDESEEALLVDPSSPDMTVFSMLDQTTNPNVSLSQGFVAVAANPLTNIAVAVNGPGDSASIIDLGRLEQIGNSVTVGSSPEAVAIDPGKNEAVIVNTGDNTVSILSLGGIRTPQITEVSPANTFSVPSGSTGSLTVTVNGFGFSSGAQVRLDGTAVPTSISSNGRQAIATVPDAMLTSARRYTLDVLNSGGTSSNVERFLVVGTVPIGENPIGVAIDPYLNEALVTSQGSTVTGVNTCTGPGTVSVVDLDTATVSNTLPAGTCPEGVAVLPRLGLGVVANDGSNDATVFDYVNNLVDSTVNAGANPAGVAIHPDTALALVANSTINANAGSLSAFTVSSGTASPTVTSVSVDQIPFGLAVDPIDNLGIVTASGQNMVDGLSLSPSTASLVGRVIGFENPLDATFDPMTDTYLVADSLNNQIGIVDAKTLDLYDFHAGIDPTAIAYNFQSATGVTVDQATNALSIFDFLATNPPNSQLLINTAQVEIILPFGGSEEFSVAINPTTNIATVVDQANGRLLLIPLP